MLFEWFSDHLTAHCWLQGALRGTLGELKGTAPPRFFFIGAHAVFILFPLFFFGFHQIWTNVPWVVAGFFSDMSCLDCTCVAGMHMLHCWDNFVALFSHCFWRQKSGSGHVPRFRLWGCFGEPLGMLRGTFRKNNAGIFIVFHFQTAFASHLTHNKKNNVEQPYWRFYVLDKFYNVIWMIFWSSDGTLLASGGA